MNQNNITPNSTMHANQALLYQHVDFLTTLRPFRNHMNVASLDQVCDYLKHEFTTYRLDLHELLNLKIFLPLFEIFLHTQV